MVAIVAVAIVAVAITGVLLVALVGVGAWLLLGPADSAAQVTDYRDQKDLLTSEHEAGDIEYRVNPPVGGNHSAVWQNCQGDVYDAPIPDEHAVHSLEHGAVWITYRSGLPKADVENLADRVRGKDYLMMSPHPDLDSPISLQAWGLQLKTDSADDPAIDTFITEHRMNAGPEKGAPCSGGDTDTGDKPKDAD